MFNTKLRSIVIASGMAVAAAGILAVQQVQADHHTTQAIAVIHGTAGNDGIHGQVTFTQQDDGVLIEAHIMGLTPGQHGFHIHQYGDISADDGTSAGGHFNPSDDPHAGPMDGKRHMGDMGNIEANAEGHAMYKKIDKHIELNGDNSVMGRAVVVHGGADDMKSQPSGDAGPRVAVGVIGVAKSE